VDRASPVDRLSPLSVVAAAAIVVVTVAACRASPSPSPSPSASPSPSPAPAPVAAAAPPPGPAAEVDPCTDFYEYACSAWTARHPVPPDASRWTLYDEMIARNLERVHAILDEAARRPGDRLGAYYAACTDQAAIDAGGLAPLRADMDAIAAIASPRDLVAAVARLAGRGGEVPLAVYAAADFDDPGRAIAQADAAGLALPVRGDYLSDEPRARRLRADYADHLARVFARLGQPPAEAARDAARVVALERALAAATLDPVAQTDPRNLHHPTKVSRPRGAGLDWEAYLSALGARGVPVINEVQPAYFYALARLLAGDGPGDLPAWRAYLRAHLVHAMSEVLPADVAKADFDFHSRVLRGVREMRPRWRRCAELVDRDMGEELGRRFAAQAFTPRDRERVRRIAESIRAALREEIRGAPWLAGPTRREALAVLDALRIKIGHPDRWRDYSGLRVAAGDACGNAQRASAFELARQLGKIGRPVDRDEWFELPQALDAYHTGPLNEVAFTAGFLQPPIYDPAAGDAATYGALGAVMGHELTHAFDAGGRRFDHAGRMRDWWTPADAAAYDRRAACFADQYSAYTMSGLHLDGRLGLRENTADNGGLRLAYRAYRAAHPDLAGARDFFLAWGRLRCASQTAEAEREQVVSATHAPGRYRVIGVVSNMPEFGRAFACPAGAPMLRSPVCRLW